MSYTRDGTSLDISVVICTRNRAESLRQTLDHLVRAERRNLDVEIVIVDNGSNDETRIVAESFSEILPLRYLYEPRKGKYHALNRALDKKLYGRIIAFLDDDMSPMPDWFQGIWKVSNRWPGCDFFGGRIYVEWPPARIPGWARRGRLSGWAFSAQDYQGKDRIYAVGDWPSGNHFWIRSRVLADGRRFDALWATEPMFILKLTEQGCKGVQGSDAVTGHRIQPDLLLKSVIRKRALLVGRSRAHVLLACSKVKQTVFLRRRPFLFHVLCALNLVRWTLMYCMAYLGLSEDIRFEKSVIALEAMATNSEKLRIALRSYWQRINL